MDKICQLCYTESKLKGAHLENIYKIDALTKWFKYGSVSLKLVMRENEKKEEGWANLQDNS